MGAAKERTDIGSFFSMGAEIVENDWHKGEILVERHGMFRPKFIFIHNGKQIAELNWKRARTGIYQAKGLRLELQIGTLAKVILAKDEMSNISRLKVKNPLNPRKAKLLIQLSDSDGFIVRQKCENLSSSEFSLHVTKQHYVTELVDFKFSLQPRPRSRVIARINVPPIMRWEAHHFHHLLALVMARIAFMQERGLNRDHQHNRSPREVPVLTRNGNLSR